MRVEIEAKLNLCLAIRGTEGNRHLIDSLFVPVGIKDAVSGEKAEKVEVAYTDGRVYERDTAYLAARAVIERYAMGGARFLIEKGIPEGAGLGGSSADAGAVARILCGLYGREDVDVGLLAAIGSDVPYFYRGGAARVRGTGNICEEAEVPRLYKVVVVPDGKVNTGECYGLYDKIGGEDGDVEEFIGELKRGRLPKPFNALRRAAETLNPGIADAVRILESVGFTAGMTGSGSAAFGMENDREAYKYKLRKLSDCASKFGVYAEKE